MTRQEAQIALNRAAERAWTDRDDDSMILLGRALMVLAALDGREGRPQVRLGKTWAELERDTTEARRRCKESGGKDPCGQWLCPRCHAKPNIPLPDALMTPRGAKGA